MPVSWGVVPSSFFWKTPAAALTAHADGDDPERALAAGFQAHVTKPFEPAELTRVVADLARRAAV